MKNKYLFISGVVATMLFSGCSSSYNPLLQSSPTPSNNNIRPATQIETLPRYNQPSVEKEERFNLDFRSVAIKTKADPSYSRMGLNENKRWFKETTYLLWNRDISKSQYIKEGLSRFPNNRYEFEFVANNIAANTVISNNIQPINPQPITQPNVENGQGQQSY